MKRRENLLNMSYCPTLDKLDGKAFMPISHGLGGNNIRFKGLNSVLGSHHIKNLYSFEISWIIAKTLPIRKLCRCKFFSCSW